MPPHIYASSAAQLRADIIDRASMATSTPSLDQAMAVEGLYRVDADGFRQLVSDRYLDRRTAYYLLSVGQLIRSRLVSRSAADEIGWTKLALIAGWQKRHPHASRGEMADLVTRAKDHTVAQLKLVLQRRRQKPERKCVLLYFTPEQYRVFSEAMQRGDAVRTPRGWAGKEAALIRVIEGSKSRRT